MPEMPSGHVASASNGTIAIGIIVAAPPTISIVSWARAADSGTSASRHTASQRPSERIIEMRNPGVAVWSGGGIGAMLGARRACATPCDRDARAL